jgi:hypothetical protein
MVTTHHLREFSLDCLHWAEQVRNPSARQTIVSVARFWLNIAETVDRSVEDGRGERLRDLKRKLD